VRRQRLEQPNAQRALEHMLAHLNGLDAQLGALEHELAALATSDPWRDPVAWLCRFRGIGLRTAGCWPRSATSAASARRAS